MKKTIFILLLISFFKTSLAGVTTIEYQNVPGWVNYPMGCIFNQPPPPVQVGGFSHYAVSGGVRYIGNAITLETSATGGGTVFGIYYGFKKDFIYSIVVEAAELSGNGGTGVNLRIAMNNALTRNSLGCYPESWTPMNNGAIYTYQSPNLIYNTYNTYTVLNNFTVTSTGNNYLLVGASQYSAAGGNHNVGIRKIIITETPPSCNLPAPTGLSISNDKSRISWNTVTGAASYKLNIQNNRGGTITNTTYSLTSNSYTYCPQQGDVITCTVEAVCSNTISGAISSPLSYTFNPPSGVATNLTATLNFPPGSSYYGYYLNFNTVPGVTDYTMEWFDVTTNTLQGTRSISNTGLNSCFFYQFASGRTYKYRVATSSGCGNGAYSAWSSNILPPVATCSTGPFSYSLAQSRGCGGASTCTFTNLSWPAISGVTQYQIEYVIFNTGTGVNLPTGTTTSTTAAVTVYYTALSGTGWNIKYRVRANCSGTWGNFSGWSSTFFLQ